MSFFVWDQKNQWEFKGDQGMECSLSLYLYTCMCMCMCVCVPVNQRGTREISGSLRANRVWRAPGSDFSPDCEENLSGVMSLFARIYFFVCHFSDSYIHERESHIYGGNAAGRPASVWFVLHECERAPNGNFFSPKKVPRGGAGGQGVRVWCYRQPQKFRQESLAVASSEGPL